MKIRHLLGACYILSIALLFFCFVSNAEDFSQLTNSVINRTSVADYEKYDKYGITFEYPTDWKIKDEEEASSRGSIKLYKLGLSGSSYIFTSTIKISWDDSMANVDPEEFLNLLVELYKQDQNFTNVVVEDSSPIIVDGNSAAMKVMNLESTSGTIYKDRNIAFTSSNSKRWIRMEHYTMLELDDEATFNHIVVSFHDGMKAKR